LFFVNCCSLAALCCCCLLDACFWGDITLHKVDGVHVYFEFELIIVLNSIFYFTCWLFAFYESEVMNYCFQILYCLIKGLFVFYFPSVSFDAFIWKFYLLLAFVLFWWICLIFCCMNLLIITTSRAEQNLSNVSKNKMHT
jgi:hypothetical protein